jgi:hypothetical protein
MDSEFLEMCISTFNEMALDPEIYPRQDCPIIFMYPGEDYADKRTGYMIDLGLSDADLAVPLVYRQYHVLRNVTGNGGADEETPDNLCTCYGVIATIPNDSDLESTIRSAFPAYFTAICNMMDAWSTGHNCTPRFVLVFLDRVEDNTTVDDNDVEICADANIISTMVQ